MVLQLGKPASYIFILWLNKRYSVLYDFQVGAILAYKPFTFKGLCAGKTNHAPWLRSRLLREAELRTGCGSGLFLLDSQSFHLPELPKQEKIVLLKQKFIPLPTCLRRMPSIKRTTVWGSLAWVSFCLLTHHMHTHPLTSILQSTPENPHSE